MMKKNRMVVWLLFIAGLTGSVLAWRHYQASSKESFKIITYQDEEILPYWTPAMQHYQQGQYVEARRLLEQHLSLFPEHAEALYYLGLCHLELGEEDQAAHIMELVRMNDSLLYADATWYLGLAHIKVGKQEEARMLMSELAEGPQAYYSAKAKVILRDFLSTN